MTHQSQRIALSVLVLSGFLFGAAHSLASDFHSARIAALGGAGHAGPVLNDAIYLNPSYMAFVPTYAVQGNYTWSNYRDGSYHYKIQNASVQDGRSDLFQAGLAYTHREDGSIFHLGTGKALIPQKLSVGLGAKYYLPSALTGTDKMIDGNLSVTGIPIEEVQTVLVIDNLGESSTGKQYGFYREVTLGVKYNVEKIVLLYVDPHYTPNLKTSSTFGYEIGAEWPFMVDLYLRGGYFRSSVIPTLSNNTRGRGFGMGLGYIAPRATLDYGISRVLEPIIGTVQVIEFTIFLS